MSNNAFRILFDRATAYDMAKKGYFVLLINILGVVQDKPFVFITVSVMLK